MKPSVNVIRYSTHANLAWKPVTTYAFAASTAVSVVSAGEVANVACTYPLAFLSTESGVTLVAVLALRPDENLFVGPNGQWLTPYVPASLRAYPFKLLGGEGDQLHLGYLDVSDFIVAEGQGEPFFSADEQPTERVRQIATFLTQLHRGLKLTESASERLASARILEPWPLKVRHDDGERQVDGLMRVNEAALNALSDDEFASLRRDGALPIAYSQLLSMVNISTLGQLAQAHHSYAATVAKQRAEVSSLFEGDVSAEQIDWDAMLKND